MNPVEEVMEKVQNVCTLFGGDLTQEASFLSELIEELTDQLSDVRQEMRERELRQKYTPEKGDEP